MLGSFQKVDMEYEKICKGRGFVYACGDQLYVRVKTKRDTLYLKCHVDHCDGSAKLRNGVFSVGVRIHVRCRLKIIVR